MTSSFRGRRALLVLAVLLAIPILGAGVVWFWIQRTADRKWAEAKFRIQELTRAHPATLPLPPPTELSKELQIHFVAAIREAARRNGSQKVKASGLVDVYYREEVNAVLDDAQDFLDRLHEGARRCAATPAEFPPGWRGEWDHLTMRFVLDCGLLRARRYRDEGAAWDAAESLLDSLQLARFWAASGKGDNRLDSLHCLNLPLQQLGSLLSHQTFSPNQLLQIEGELGPLEAAMRPPSASLESRMARWAEGLETWDLEDTGVMSFAPYRWRYLLPKHLMKAEAFEFNDRYVHRMLASEAKSYSELAQVMDQFRQEVRESKNPLIEDFPIRSSSELGGLEGVAQMRLLRIAARYRASGEILPLKDPFGADFLHRRTGNRMKFWSRGSDGRDDGGDPAKDLVIEVPLNE